MCVCLYAHTYRYMYVITHVTHGLTELGDQTYVAQPLCECLYQWAILLAHLLCLKLFPMKLHTEGLVCAQQFSVREATPSLYHCPSTSVAWQTSTALEAQLCWALCLRLPLKGCLFSPKLRGDSLSLITLAHNTEHVFWWKSSILFWVSTKELCFIRSVKNSFLKKDLLIVYTVFCLPARREHQISL